MAIQLDTAAAVALVGAVGGIATEVLHWRGLVIAGKWPKYGKSISYWTLSLMLIGLGSVVAWLQFGSKGDALVVLQIGAAAPMFLQKATNLGPPPTGGMGFNGLEPRRTVLDFFRW